MANSYVLVRKSNNRVVGVNKNAITPAPAAPVEEFFEQWIGIDWQRIIVTRTGVDTYNNTGNKIKRAFNNTFDSDVDTRIDGATTLSDLKTELKVLFKKLSIR